MAPILLVIAAFGGEFCVETKAIAVVVDLINGLSTVTVNFLCSTLKAVKRPLDTKHKKAAFQGNEN